jgi:spore protease
MLEMIKKKLGAHVRKIHLYQSSLFHQYSPRTDLAVEAHEILRGTAPSVSGIDESSESLEGIDISRVHVRTKVAERKIGKKKGRYVTIQAPGIRRRDPELQARVAEQFAKEFKSMLNLPPNASILVVGLGNANVTPDALGPLVVEKLFVTRHLFQYMPEVLGDGQGYRSISAIAPGVLGITGIETSEVVKGIVERIRPDAVVAIDALAARSLGRVNSTIQIADSGIQPGAGVGNRRKALDEETLGVPVIAVGIPTVVDAATIANDAIEMVLNQLAESVPGNGANQVFDQLSANEKWQMIRELLEPMGHNLVVTPKEIDEFMEDMAQVVAKGLNVAMHPAMTMEDAAQLTH